MSRFRGAWQSLNFDKEYLFGFETLVFATAGILSRNNQIVILQKRKVNLKSHHMTHLTVVCYWILHLPVKLTSTLKSVITCTFKNKQVSIEIMILKYILIYHKCLLVHSAVKFIHI